ncbi:MAG: putative porin [Candidatus Sericytochromatia bacterium]|nr:putative porin [Candidatus Sericytochromatia bacterium]
MTHIRRFTAALTAALLLPLPVFASPAGNVPAAGASDTVAQASDAPAVVANAEVPLSMADRLQELQDFSDRHDSELDRQGSLLQQLDRALAPSFNGSLGVRYQFASTFAAPAIANLPQTRLRLGIQSRQPGPFRYEVRLVTGATDLPNQSWVPFGAFWGKTPIALDRYNLSWRPVQPFTLTAGKFSDPFANSELLWDNDVQPQGLLQSLSLDQWLPASMKANVDVGELVMAANGSDSGAYAIGGKLSLSQQATPWLKLDGSVGYYDFINAQAMATPNLSLGARPTLALRNRLDASGTRLLNDFNLLNVFARASIDVFPDVPLRLTADHVINMASPDQNRGLRLGAFIGSVKDPGGVMGVYRFKYLESDSTISAFAEDIIGGTDVVAHEVSVTGRLLPRTFVEGTVQMLNRLSTAGAPLWHFRLAFLQEF